MLVLASASPRRKDLLTQAGFAFIVIPANVIEERRPDEEPTAFVRRLAQEKAQAIFDQLSRASSAEKILVLGADTIVVVAEQILGKPIDAEDAARMLRLLSGRTHQVITGVCLISKEDTQVVAETTTVSMREISDSEIAAYVETGEPMDKAGAYAIQGHAARWIPRIEGCYFNVVGLPIARVTELLVSAGLKETGQSLPEPR
jgi:septum formation protein